MSRWPLGAILLRGTILATCCPIAGHPHEAPSTVGSPASRIAGLRTVGDTVSCGTKPIGEITVATLNRAPIVTLSANGHAVTLILDTGAERTVITPPAAERIGAQRPSIEFQSQMRGIAGALATHEVELRSFAAGEVSIPWRRVLVAPVAMARVFPAPLDGLLGADTLTDFDIDLDLPRHRMVLYQKQSCPTAAPDWAGPYASIDTGLSRGEHLFFPVQLDGHRIIAYIDTGSQITALSTTMARALGLSDGMLARDRSVTTRDVAAELLASHVHRFAKLEVATVVVRNPEVVVTDLKLDDADMILGIDFLSSRRLWLSYGSRRIFLSSR